MNIIKGNIPNTLTCMNLLSGVMAIICASHGMQEWWGLTGTYWAWIFIAIASVADFSDGFAARTLHAESPLGQELDSLSDNVSFGVAPMLALFFLLEELRPGCWVKWCALIIPLWGVVRLARFNIDDSQTTDFVGLPIPANAIFWIGYMAMLTSGCEIMSLWYALLPIMLVESWLMVSPFRMFSLKFKSFGWKGNELRWILLVAAVALISTLRVSGLMWLIVFYVALSLCIRNRE